MNTKQTRQKQLVDLLNEASEAYYNTGDTLMEDKEFDELLDELLKLEAETGVILPNSPTQRPGISPSADSRLAKITHEFPALSLSKTKDREFLAEWLGDKEGCLTLKYDGLTVVATYEDGELKSLVTRGNGITGESVIHNAENLKGLPKKIPYKGKIIIRGEALISYNEFNRINESLEEGEPAYKNPRNLASSQIRRLEGDRDRKLTFFAFAYVYGEDKPKLYSEQMKALRALGINSAKGRIVTSQTITDVVDEFERDILDNLPVPTDGLVLTYNDQEYADSLGSTGKYPKGSIAFKFKNDVYTTTLQSVEWSVGRTGLITPVAVFSPVEIDGNTICRASAHNITVMQKLKLRRNEEIGVYLANMIIPTLDGSMAPEDAVCDIEIPEVCPVCGGLTEIVSSDKSGHEVKTLRCTSATCAAKHLGQFTRFVDRDAINIIGLGEEMLSTFISHGWLQNVTDIFTLENHRKEIVSLEGFGEKAADNLFAAVNKAKTAGIEPWRLLYSLAIENVGHTASKAILRACGNSLDTLADKLDTDYDFTVIPDIGPVINDSLKAWWAVPQNRQIFFALTNIIKVNVPEAPKPAAENENGVASEVSNLSGITFVITGSVNTFKNRDEFIAYVEARNGKVSGSVSKNTNYLVNNDVTSSSGKNKKAKELGVSIISEATFREMFP